MVYLISNEKSSENKNFIVNRNKTSFNGIIDGSYDQFGPYQRHRSVNHHGSFIGKLWYKLTKPIKTLIKDVIELPGTMFNHAFHKNKTLPNGKHHERFITNDILPKKLLDVMDGQIADIPESQNPFLKNLPFVTP